MQIAEQLAPNTICEAVCRDALHDDHSGPQANTVQHVRMSILDRCARNIDQMTVVLWRKRVLPGRMTLVLVRRTLDGFDEGWIDFEWLASTVKETVFIETASRRLVNPISDTL